jgi:MFS family permease
MAAIYAIVQATGHGWGSSDVLGFGALAAALMAAFLALESRIDNPIMPLRIFQLRGLARASLVRGFLVTGMYSTFFLGTLYLEHVRHYSALQTGAAFLPWTITVAILSRGVTQRLVGRFGQLPVLVAGMTSAITGLLLFSTVGPQTSFFPTVFLACFAVGLGIGMAFMPLLTIAMADVPTADAGLASGITNVSQQISGAVGLAVLSTIAANHTKGLIAAHEGHVTSLIGGYHVAFLVGAVVIAAGLVLVPVLLNPRATRRALHLAQASDETDATITHELEREAA